MNKLPNDDFCILPWVELQLSSSGVVKTCCEQVSAYATDPRKDFREIFNSEPLREIRRAFKKGDVPDACRACVERSRTGYNYKTARNPGWIERKEELLKATDEDGRVSTPVRFLDLRLSNLCNLVCRTCDSVSSNRWTEIERILGWDSLPLTKWNQEEVTNNILKLLPDVEEIYFAGGEPLIIDGHYAILDWLIENKHTNTKLSYNTNLSKISYKGNDIRSYWEKFDQVDVYVSIDSMGERGEYIREGSSWEQTQKNLEALKKYVKCANTVVSVYNAFSILELVEWLQKEYDLVANLYGLHMPKSMSITTFPPELKKELTALYRDFLSKNSHFTFGQVQSLQNLETYMNHADHTKEAYEFKRVNKFLDQFHGKNFVTTFPELAEWYNNISLEIQS